MRSIACISAAERGRVRQRVEGEKGKHVFVCERETGPEKKYACVIE